MIRINEIDSHMIQYYLDLEKQVKAISEFSLAYGQIQKIYSTAYYVSLSIRSPGQTWHLYLGRGNGQEGVWLHNQPPVSALRRKDNFLEYLRKHISSCSFVSLDLDKHDRIVKLSYQKFGQLQSMLFFWKARKLYFIHHFQERPESPFKLLLSWHGKTTTPITEDLPELYEFFNEVGRRTDMKHDMHSQKEMPISDLLEEELKAAKLKEVVSGPGFLQRKISNIQDDLSRTRQWSKFQDILDQDHSLDMYELKVGDHKVKFEGELNPYERRNLLFEKIKKLKRGETILQKRLEDTELLLAGKSSEPKVTSMLPMTKPIWGKEDLSSKDTKPIQERDDFKIFKQDGYSVGVGLSSSGNDQLRNKWASKEDLWLHLDGLKSSHVIVKLQGKSGVDPETLNVAATILAHFSRFSDEWIPVIYTQVKNLKGVSGSPGMVIYKKEKHLRCPKVADLDWLKEA